MTVDLAHLVRINVDRPDAEIASFQVEPVDHAPGTPSTGGLRRVKGTTTDGVAWSFFVKTIHSVRHWPHIGLVPESARAQFIADFRWRTEADAYRSGLPLPEGLRLPHLYLIDDLGDERLDLWMEDVTPAAVEWDLVRYGAAARLLGRLAALRPMESSAHPAALRMYVTGRVVNGLLPVLRDAATWQHPLIAPYADPLLRKDLLALGERIPSLLDAVDRLPHTLTHGDASPQNLLVPADAPDEFVAIDWGWQNPAPVGFDLGQLFVGLAHQGLTEPGELPVLHRTIESAYLRGLADEGMPGDHAGFGYAATLVLRSAFSAIPVEHLGAPITPDLEDLFRKRIGLARFIADIGLGLGSTATESGRHGTVTYERW